ncbi:hypothetical protein GQ457_18G011620 [Hibiscus cannabinus]
MSESQGTQSSQSCGHTSAQSSSPTKGNDPTTTSATTNKKTVRKKQQPRLNCWSHFTKYKTEDGELRVKCIHFGKTYSIETGGSTTNSNHHLKTCLKKPRGNTSDHRQSKLTFSKIDSEYANSTFSTWKFDEDAIKNVLIHMIIVDELPFRIVDGEGFKLFLSIACPRFHLSSRFTIRRDCLDLFNSMKRVMKNSFGKDAKSRNCLTTDTWTSLQRVSYMVLTAHWIDDEWIHLNTCVANGKYMHTRCVAHVLNLIVQEGVKYASVSVDRVRAVVRYIRASPSRMKKFYNRAEEEMIDTNSHLCLDVPTRWNSTYMMLKVAEKYERAFDSYGREDPSFFVDLTAGDGVPTIGDWENVSGSLYVTSHFFWETLIDIHCLLDWWSNCEDLDIIFMASKMRDKYNKYWDDAKKINFLVYLAIILDPRRKMDFASFGLHLLFPNVASEIMKVIDKEFHCLFNEYFGFAGRVMVHQDQSSIPTKFSEPTEFNQSNMSFVVQQFLLKKQRVGLEIKSELDKYLAEGEEADNSSSFDLLFWWKLNSPRYLILGQLARDVFSTPISTVSSESAFNIGRRVLDGFRSSLTPKMVEALICTQDWLRKSKDPIKLDEYVRELQDMEDGNI